MWTRKQFNMFIFLALFRAYYLWSITVNVFSSCWTTYTEHQDRCTFLVFIDVLLRLDVRSILFRNRSSSFSVGLPRSACAIVSIVSVFMINILASHITDQQVSIFRQSVTKNSSNSSKANGRMAIFICRPQVRKACREIAISRHEKKNLLKKTETEPKLKLGYCVKPCFGV